MDDSLFKGMLVLELASVLAGPSVGQFFAELGAKVIKIENAATNGDVTRRWKLKTEDANESISAYFSAVNWGKTSLPLDLRLPGDLTRLKELASQADVVIASYKPGDAEKLQVSYQDLQKLNPKLIYGHVTGYGPTSELAGYDAVVQAESGFMYLNGQADGPPTKMPVALIDVLAAHQLKEAILVALLQRERTGLGQLVQVSLLHAAVSALANQATAYLVAGQNPERMGSEHPTIVPYGTLFDTKDQKQLVLAIGDDRQFKKLCNILGAPGMANDPKFSTNYSRVQHREEVNQALRTLILRQDRDTLLNALHKLHVPAGAVNSVEDAFAMPLAQPLLLQHNGGKSGVRQAAFTLSGLELKKISPPPPYIPPEKDI